ncbi:MAG TPA: hypothetical protein VKH81_17100 [Candidatus Angelobacter sp.]|nr:hypothetical protein [Candidatus Angelobacter sp.]
MNKVRAVIFLCTAMLAVGAFALQYPSGSQQPQPQMQQPGMHEPSQSQPPQTPSQNPGAMQPGQQGQPGQQPGAAQSNAGSNIDEQVQILSQQLNLTPDQQAKVKTALQDQHTQAMTIIQDSSLQREDKIQKIHALRESTIAKVRGTLTSDEQKTKFDQMVQAQDDRLHQQQPQQAPPPQPKP